MKTACLDEQGKAVEVEVERVALKIELSSWLPGGCAATTANHDKFLVTLVILSLLAVAVLGGAFLFLWPLRGV